VNIFGVILFWLLIVVAAILFGGLIWMLGLSVLASTFKVPNLAIGYWDSIKVMLVTGAMFGGIFYNKGKND
jgi:hypothetical protein